MSGRPKTVLALRSVCRIIQPSKYSSHTQEIMRSIRFNVTIIADLPEGRVAYKLKHAKHRIEKINLVLQERADEVFSAQLSPAPTDIRVENTPD